MCCIISFCIWILLYTFNVSFTNIINWVCIFFNSFVVKELDAFKVYEVMVCVDVVFSTICRRTNIWSIAHFCLQKSRWIFQLIFHTICWMLFCMLHISELFPGSHLYVVVQWYQYSVHLVPVYWNKFLWLPHLLYLVMIFLFYQVRCYLVWYCDFDLFTALGYGWRVILL